MAGSPTLSDWKTALASGVKIDVLLESLNNTKKTEADKESPTSDYVEQGQSLCVVFSLVFFILISPFCVW